MGFLLSCWVIQMVPLFEEAGRYSKENEKSLAYTASR